MNADFNNFNSTIPDQLTLAQQVQALTGENMRLHKILTRPQDSEHDYQIIFSDPVRHECYLCTEKFNGQQLSSKFMDYSLDSAIYYVNPLKAADEQLILLTFTSRFTLQKKNLLLKTQVLYHPSKLITFLSVNGIEIINKMNRKKQGELLQKRIGSMIVYQPAIYLTGWYKDANSTYKYRYLTHNDVDVPAQEPLKYKIWNVCPNSHVTTFADWEQLFRLLVSSELVIQFQHLSCLPFIQTLLEKYSLGCDKIINIVCSSIHGKTECFLKSIFNLYNPTASFYELPMSSKKLIALLKSAKDEPLVFVLYKQASTKYQRDILSQNLEMLLHYNHSPVSESNELTNNYVPFVISGEPLYATAAENVFEIHIDSCLIQQKELPLMKYSLLATLIKDFINYIEQNMIHFDKIITMYAEIQQEDVLDSYANLYKSLLVVNKLLYNFFSLDPNTDQANLATQNDLAKKCIFNNCTVAEHSVDLDGVSDYFIQIFLKLLETQNYEMVCITNPLSSSRICEVIFKTNSHLYIHKNLFEKILTSAQFNVSPTSMLQNLYKSGYIEADQSNSFSFRKKMGYTNEHGVLVSNRFIVFKKSDLEHFAGYEL